MANPQDEERGLARLLDPFDGPGTRRTIIPVCNAQRNLFLIEVEPRFKPGSLALREHLHTKPERVHGWKRWKNQSLS